MIPNLDPKPAQANEPRMCDQGCGRKATCYGMDTIPGGWGGHYCDECVTALKFIPTDRKAYT